MASPIPVFQTLIRVETFRAQVLEHFKKEIADGHEFDPRDIQRFRDIDEYATMFLQHGQFQAEFDLDRALRLFQGCMAWRKRHRVYDISTNEFPSNYFDRHAIYFKNHDIHNHPLLHFVVRTFNKGEEDNEAVKRFITYNLERHVRRHPGQRIVIFFDMSETGLKHLDYDLVKFIIASAQIYYPGLLAYMLIYKLPFILTAAWKIIRSWLPAEAEQFIKFVDMKSLTQFVRPEQLSTAMGGSDAIEYTHIRDAANDAVDDPMNVNSKKKVTFADTGSADFQPSSSPVESTGLTDVLLKNDSSFHEDFSTLDDSSASLSSPLESPQSASRKKPAAVNGYSSEEKVSHGLAIRPYDEIIFERADSSGPEPTDCIQRLVLKNMGDKILTFKIKTTSPEKFRVKPGCSLLHPGDSANVTVYLLKAHCTPTSLIHKEKFLIIWTLIGQDLKQSQLVDFWKNVPSSVLYEHRLKCSFGNKSSSVPPINPPHETVPSPVPVSSDPSLVEMQKLLKDSMALQQTIQRHTSSDLQQIRNLLLIIFVLAILIFLWDIYKYAVPYSSSTSDSDL